MKELTDLKDKSRSSKNETKLQTHLWTSSYESHSKETAVELSLQAVLSASFLSSVKQRLTLIGLSFRYPKKDRLEYCESALLDNIRISFLSIASKNSQKTHKYTHKHTHTHREREREREQKNKKKRESRKEREKTIWRKNTTLSKPVE